MTNHMDTNGYKSDHFGTHMHKPDHQSQSHRVMMQEIYRIAVRVSRSQTKCDWSTTTYGRSKALLQQQEPLQLLPMVLNGTGSGIIPLPTCRLAPAISSHVKACTTKIVTLRNLRSKQTQQDFTSADGRLNTRLNAINPFHPSYLLPYALWSWGCSDLPIRHTVIIPNISQYIHLARYPNSKVCWLPKPAKPPARPRRRKSHRSQVVALAASEAAGHSWAKRSQIWLA